MLLLCLAPLSRFRAVLVFSLLCGCALPAAAEVEVIVEGVTAELERNIRLFLSIEQQKDHELLGEGRIRRLHRKANDEIHRALRPFGFYRPSIEPSLTRQGDNQWRASYRVDAGTGIPIQSFELEIGQQAQADPVFQQILQGLPLKVGDVLRHDLYESIKVALLNAAAERGYVEARFVTNQVEVDLAQYQAAIRLHFDAGPRYRYGEVSITQPVLERKLMDRFIQIEQGKPFLSSDLIALQRSLNDSDYFRRIEVNQGQADAETRQIPVEITVEPRKPNRYSLGLGFGTDTGARARLGWDKPLINPRGHRFGSELRLSEIENSLSAQYSIPILNPRTDRLVYSAGLIDETTDTSESRIATLGASIHRSRGQWREQLSLDYQREEFEVGDDRDRISLLLPGVSLSRTWGSNAILTLDGVRLDIDFQFAHDDLGSDVELYQGQLGIKFIQQVASRHRLIARGRLGNTETENFDALPSSLRFFAGGAQSVRGYGYESLGPLDANGDVEGGRYLMVGSLEWETRLRGRWGIALFYDIGNALNDLDDPLETGAGFGLRWRSPIGPVRIDLASATSRKSDPWRLHINIGPDL